MKHKYSNNYVVFLFIFYVPSLLLAFQNITITAEVKANIRSRVESGENPGISIGVIDTDGTEFYNYGKKSVSESEQVDEHTVYEIGSITKVFTTTILADMVIRGKINLNAPVEIYLPDGVTIPERNGKKITFEHLATHTSALPRMPDNFKPADILNPYADYTVDMMYEFLSGCELEREIGGKYEYSNLGMGFLGHVLTLIAGKDFETLVKDVICLPLDMNRTAITLTPVMEKHLAKGHIGGKVVKNWDLPALAGAGALRSTVTDMLMFISANLGFTQTTLHKAMKMTHEPRINAASQMQVGLGWHINDNGNTHIIWHNGGTGGYRTFTGFIREKKTGVVVLSNSNVSVDDVGFHLLDNSYGLKIIRETKELPAEILERYTGEYRLEDNKTITVIKSINSLVIKNEDGKLRRFYPESETVFFIKGLNVTITFLKDDTGNVTGLLLRENGNEQKAEKTE